MNGTDYLQIACANASSMNMFKNKLSNIPEGWVTHSWKKMLTLDGNLVKLC